MRGKSQGPLSVYSVKNARFAQSMDCAYTYVSNLFIFYFNFFNFFNFILLIRARTWLAITS